MAERRPSSHRGRLDRKQLGALGESAARQFLEGKGLRTVATNVRTRYGEIDIVARDGDELVFVEVKARAVDASVGPLDAISPIRAQRMKRLAEAYLGERAQDVPWRIDVVAVFLTTNDQVLRIEHVAHALSE